MSPGRFGFNRHHGEQVAIRHARSCFRFGLGLRSPRTGILMILGGLRVIDRGVPLPFDFLLILTSCPCPSCFWTLHAPQSPRCRTAKTHPTLLRQ